MIQSASWANRALVEWMGLAGVAMRLILTCYLGENLTKENIPS